jgi:replicative DNA helicase
MIEASQRVHAARTAAQVAADLDIVRDGAAPVATGFEPLDGALQGGFRTRELAILGGPPGIGKTAIALQWARNAAATGHAVVFACYEHDEPTLLGRLLAQEIAAVERETGRSTSHTRETVRAIARGQTRLEDELPGDLVLRASYERLDDYAHRLWLLRASGIDTGLDELFEVADEFGPGTVLFVDYLQKIPSAFDSSTEADRVIHLVEGLKEIALDREIALVAVVAGDEAALSARRLRLHHLRGSAGLAYEADIVLMMNEKALAVSKAHSAYDALRAEEFSRQIVLSIDKNRSGPAPVDMEFRKDLTHFRFEPLGSIVQDRLVDDMLNPE